MKEIEYSYVDKSEMICLIDLPSDLTMGELQVILNDWPGWVLKWRPQ